MAPRPDRVAAPLILLMAAVVLAATSRTAVASAVVTAIGSNTGGL
jgi:hypothetical protein